MKLTRNTISLAVLAVLALMAVFAAMGHPVTQYLPHDMLALMGAGAMPIALGDTSLVEIKKIVEDQGTTWEEYKKTNDERIAKLAKGESVTELEQKLAKMDLALNETSSALKEIAAKAGRLSNVSGSDDKEEAKEREAFNRKAKSFKSDTNGFAPLDQAGYAAYKSGIKQYIRKGREVMTPDELKTINVGTDPQGGFLIGEDMESTIDRVVGRYSAMRQVARVIPIGNASYKKLVKTSGTAGASRGNENTAPSNGTSPNWVELTFTPGTYLSEQRITQESLEDSVQDVEGDLIQEMGIEFAEQEGADFITGEGTNGAKGLLAYDTVANGSYSWGKLGFVVTGGASGFASQNPSDALIDLQHALKRQYRANGVWTMNDATLGTIRKFKDGNGIYLWAPSGLLNGAVGQLLGHAVVTDDFMPDLGAGAFPIAFADFNRGYYIVDRVGMSILRDPFTAVPHVKFIGRRRVGGGVANFEAIKLLKCST